MSGDGFDIGLDVGLEIGSMVMTGFRGGSLDDPRLREDLNILKAGGIKNLILFDAHLPTGGIRNITSPDQLRALTDDLRHELGADLLIAIDQEGGMVNRLGCFEDDAISSMLSAKMMGVMTAEQIRAVIEPVGKALRGCGVDLTFSPCVDLAIHPENPIAERGRSLGKDRARVARAASAIVRAYESCGVGCCLKHFPGHGSTSVDTHEGVADVTTSWCEDEMGVYGDVLEEIGEIPVGVMMGHLVHRGFDDAFPASLSRSMTEGLLRSEVGFEGVVFTDSMDMDAIRDRYSVEESTVGAVRGGADVVVDGFNRPGEKVEHPGIRMVNAIKEGIVRGEIEASAVESSIRRRDGLMSVFDR